MRLYLMGTRELEDPREHPEWAELLPVGRWKKAISLLQPEDRKNSAGAGWLLRYVLWEEGVSPEAPVRYGAHGKPYCDGMHFNLSHSGEYVLCAVGEREIGCDIQKIMPCRPAMVRRFFSPEEQEYIFSVEGRERDIRFITIWSRKESMLKRTGEGLTRDLRQVCCLSGEGFYDIQCGEYRICVSCERAEDAWEACVRLILVDACLAVAR